MDNLQLGQTVGNAVAIAGINGFINEEFTLVLSDINSEENYIKIDLVNNDQQTQYSFSILNLSDGGIEMTIVSPADNNFYTSGNSLEINLLGIFMNPNPSLLQFSVVVFSELNDDTFNQFDFIVDFVFKNDFLFQ